MIDIKKNRFVIFYVFNIILLIIIILVALPVSEYLNKTYFKDTEYVKDQSIINPDAKSTEILDRKIKIKFVADIEKNLKIEFGPTEDFINLKIGESKTISYSGTNISNKKLVSTAIFEASPDKISPYIVKTECFCFTEQTIEPGETKIFTMNFFIDPSMNLDENLVDLEELVFTYQFSEYKS